MAGKITSSKAKPSKPTANNSLSIEDDVTLKLNKKEATLNDNSSINKVEHNKINTKDIGKHEVEYVLKGRNNEVKKTLIIEVKPNVTNIIKGVKDENVNPNEEKIFYAKDYKDAEECYYKASEYVRNAMLNCTIEPVLKDENVFRDEQNIIGYKLNSVK